MKSNYVFIYNHMLRFNSKIYLASHPNVDTRRNQYIIYLSSYSTCVISLEPRAGPLAIGI